MNLRRHLSRMSLQQLASRVKRKKRMRRPLPPKAIERKYTRALQPYLAKMHDIVKQNLLPKLPQLKAHVRIIRGDDRSYPFTKAQEERIDTFLRENVGLMADLAERETRADGPLDDVEAIFQAMRDQLDNAWGDQDLAALADSIGEDVTAYSQAQLRAMLGDALGGEVPFLAITPGTDLAQKGFVKDNVRLIKGLSEQYYGQLETMVNDTVRSGSSTADLAAQIEDRFEVTSNRAAFIARDQVSKLNGDIAQAQQTDLGITHYTWRTSLDDRVRPDHASKEGEVFAWDDPPEVGHPGEDFQCRCTAEPIIPELEDRTDAFDPNQPRDKKGEWTSGGSTPDMYEIFGVTPSALEAPVEYVQTKYRLELPEKTLPYEHAVMHDYVSKEHDEHAREFIAANPTANAQDYAKHVGYGNTDVVFKYDFFGKGNPEANSAGRILRGTASEAEGTAAKVRYGEGFRDYLQHQYAFTQAKIGKEEIVQLYRGQKENEKNFSLASYTTNKPTAEAFAFKHEGVLVTKPTSTKDILLDHRFEPQALQSEYEKALVRDSKESVSKPPPWFVVIL